MLWSPSIARDGETWVLAWVVFFPPLHPLDTRERSLLSQLHFLGSMDSFNGSEELEVLVSTGICFHSDKQASLYLAHSSF